MSTSGEQEREKWAHRAMAESGLGFDLVVISIVKTIVEAGIIFLAF